jgi:hypothetical protein
MIAYRQGGWVEGGALLSTKYRVSNTAAAVHPV